MLAVVQRVMNSSVRVEGEKIAEIEKGFNILLGVCQGDDELDAKVLADKIINLRCFEDKQGKMNLSLSDKGGKILSIPQFTLCADCTKGRRPSFNNAAPPSQAEELYEYFNQCIIQNNIELAKGSFGAYMQVEIQNDGPVTFVLDSRKLRK